MAILTASDITWTPAPRCLICDVRITASGRNQPFAVDASGSVYCRRHGERVDATYPAALEAYLDGVRSRVTKYLDEADELLTPDDLARVDAELHR